MANNPIKASDLYKDDGAIKRAIEQLEQLQTQYKKALDSIGKQAITLKTNIQGLNATQAAHREEIKKGANAVDQLRREQEKYKTALAASETEIQTLKLAQREVTRISKLEAQLAKSKAGSYNALSAQYALNKMRLNQMTAAEREATTAGRRLERQTRLIYEEMSRLQKATGKYTLDVGKYKNAIVGFGNTLKAAFAAGGAVAVIQTVGRTITDSIRTTSEFKEQIAVLGSVSRASSDELAALESNARKLGETTQFTAKQVAELQINFARSGFNPDEIIAATEATLDLALATNSTLGEASLVVADNIRAYGLEAKETARFTDVLTAALNSSNITLENYKEASKELAPVSKVLNISVEESAAAIGILGDNGLKGTAATTTLASGLLKLSDDSKKYAKAAERLGVEVFKQNGEFVGLGKLIENLNEQFKDYTEQQKLAALSQMFGIQSAKNFAILMNATKEVVTETGKEVLNGGKALSAYAEQLERTGGAASRAADIIGDTLAGDFKELASAAEGAQINFVAFFENGIRKVIQGATSLISKVNEFLSIPLSEQLADQQVELNKLVSGLINANETIEDTNIREEVRSRLISEIQEKYPSFIQNINLETASVEELKTALDQANDSFTKKIILQRQEEELNEIFQKRATLIEDLVKLQQEQAEGGVRMSQNVIGGGIGDTTVEQDIERTQRMIDRLDEDIASINERRSAEINEINKLLGDQTEATREAAEENAKAQSSYISKADAARKKTELAAGSIAFLRDQVNKLKTAVEGSNSDEKTEGLLVKLVGAEEALEKAEEGLKLLKMKMEQQKGFDVVAPLPTSTLDRVIDLPEKSRAESLLTAFDAYQELEESRFLLTVHTEEELTKFRLKQERDRLAEILKLNTDMGLIQEETIKNQIKRLNDQITKGSLGTGKDTSIYGMLGLSFNDEEKNKLKSAFDYAKNQLTSFFGLRKQLTDQRVQESNQAVQLAQTELQTQIQLAEAGYASRVDIAQKDLALAKENQRKALREQEKAQKAQLAADTVQQASSLITASAKIFKDIPFPFSLAAVGVMLGSFAAAKIKAFQLSKKEFAEGGLEFIGGGTHASGNDTPLGFAVEGKPAYAERGESHMILKPGPTRKYKSILPEIFKTLNSGTFEQVFAYQSASQPPVNVSVGSKTNMTRTENELSAIRRQGAVRSYVDGKGRTVEVKGNRTKIYS